MHGGRLFRRFHYRMTVWLGIVRLLSLLFAVTWKYFCRWGSRQRCGSLLFYRFRYRMTLWLGIFRLLSVLFTMTWVHFCRWGNRQRTFQPKVGRSPVWLRKIWRQIFPGNNFFKPNRIIPLNRSLLYLWFFRSLATATDQVVWNWSFWQKIKQKAAGFNLLSDIFSLPSGTKMRNWTNEGICHKHSLTRSRKSNICDAALFVQSIIWHRGWMGENTFSPTGEVDIVEFLPFGAVHRDYVYRFHREERAILRSRVSLSLPLPIHSRFRVRFRVNVHRRRSDVRDSLLNQSFFEQFRCTWST